MITPDRQKFIKAAAELRLAADRLLCYAKDNEAHDAPTLTNVCLWEAFCAAFGILDVTNKDLEPPPAEHDLIFGGMTETSRARLVALISLKDAQNDVLHAEWLRRKFMAELTNKFCPKKEE